MEHALAPTFTSGSLKKVLSARSKCHGFMGPVLEPLSLSICWAMVFAPRGVSIKSIAPLLMRRTSLIFTPAPPGCQQAQTISPWPFLWAAMDIRTKSTSLFLGFLKSSDFALPGIWYHVPTFTPYAEIPIRIGIICMGSSNKTNRAEGSLSYLSCNDSNCTSFLHSYATSSHMSAK